MAADGGNESNKLPPPPLLRLNERESVGRLFFTESPPNFDDIFKRGSPNTEGNSESVGENKGPDKTGKGETERRGENNETPPRSPFFFTRPKRQTSRRPLGLRREKSSTPFTHVTAERSRPMFLPELFENFGHITHEPRSDGRDENFGCRTKLAEKKGEDARTDGRIHFAYFGVARGATLDGENKL